MKIGQTRWSAMVWKGKVDYTEHVLRTIQTRDGVKWAYWWTKVPGITWGKRSKKHGDFGWLANAPEIYRSKRVASTAPHSATKAGAVAAELATMRRWGKEEGLDSQWDEDDPLTIREHIAILERAQKRLRNRA